MSRKRRAVLARVAVSAAIAVTAVATVAAAPAGAAGRQDDFVSEASYQTLLDLRTAQAHHLAVATGAESPDVATAADAAYPADLGVVAGLVAPRTASDAGSFVAAWTAAGEVRMTVVLSALAEVGVPYVFDTAMSGVSFDCSGITMYAWAQVGVSLDHFDQSQIAATSPRSWDTAEPGDLVQYPGHVMMYLGVGEAILDAPHRGAWVRVKEYSAGKNVRLGSPIG
jgi:cell wall-associated NlpC family hydrolase